MRIVGRVVRIGFGGTVLSYAHPDRVRGQTRGFGNGRDSTPAERQSFTGRPTAAQLLVHDRGQRPILLSHSSNRFGSGHSVILTIIYKIYQVILEQLLTSCKTTTCNGLIIGKLLYLKTTKKRK